MADPKNTSPDIRDAIKRNIKQPNEVKKPTRVLCTLFNFIFTLVLTVKIEANNSDTPHAISLEYLFAISDVLGISVSRLFDDLD